MKNLQEATIDLDFAKFLHSQQLSELHAWEYCS